MFGDLKLRNSKTKSDIFRVDFSLRKEVLFVVIGSLSGAFTMFVPRFIMDAASDAQYHIVWLAFAKVVNSSAVETGIILHIFVATTIGIVAGLVLYKGNFLNVSKISHAFIYGIIAGTVVFAIFYIPVQQFLLAPNTAEVMSEHKAGLSIEEAKSELSQRHLEVLLDSFFIHLIWGVTVGVVSSFLTREFGSNYRCNVCNIEFSKARSVERHHKHRHLLKDKKITKIVIVGGGFGGVEVLQKVQRDLEDRIDVDISLVSEDNFFLFTPMLPEMATGMTEPRHISTPIRNFCKRARFFEASAENIDFENKMVTIRRTYDNKQKNLPYDYLVVAMGSRTNFFGNKEAQKNSFTIKSLSDAISIRNQIITMLENADQEDESHIRKQFLRFVVVGGGFSGVETVGEINDFVRESVSKYYRNISDEEIEIMLVSANDTILPELGSELGSFAQKSLQKNGVTIITNSKAIDVTNDMLELDNGSKINSKTIIWTAGIRVDDVIQNLACEHDVRGRIVTNENLQVKDKNNVYALGDCALVMDPKTGDAYPPTAQHCIREAKTVSSNIIGSIRDNNSLEKFSYKTKGTMAKIGKRTGVASMFGIRLKGILAWLVWRQYYLANLPTREKKVRVFLDWFVSIFFDPDITRIRNLDQKGFQ